MLAFGYKNAFSVLYVRRLVIFQYRAQIQNLQRPPDEFLETEMSKFATQLDFGNRKIVVFIGSMSFDHVIDVIADDACILYFVVAC